MTKLNIIITIFISAFILTSCGSKNQTLGIGGGDRPSGEELGLETETGDNCMNVTQYLGPELISNGSFRFC